MAIRATRSPFQSSNWRAEKSYDVGLIVDTPLGTPPGYIALGFVDRPRGNRYSVSIGPKNFKDLARAMMKADAQEAIKAFGAAMQEVDIHT